MSIVPEVSSFNRSLPTPPPESAEGVENHSAPSANHFMAELWAPGTSMKTPQNAGRLPDGFASPELLAILQAAENLIGEKLAPILKNLASQANPDDFQPPAGSDTASTPANGSAPPERPAAAGDKGAPPVAGGDKAAPPASGDKHLSMPAEAGAEAGTEHVPTAGQSKLDLSKCKEVAVDKDGKVLTDATGKPKTSEIPAAGLSEGKHVIQMDDGRQFIITLPPGFKDGTYHDENGKEAPLPVLFVMHGASQSDPSSFINETHFIKDGAEKHFAVVQPLASQHGGNYTWVAPDGGALMSRETAQKTLDSNGKPVDDYKYMDQVTSGVEQLIKSNPQDEHQHDNWDAFAFSQSSSFLMKYMSNRANMFPTVAMEGAAISEDEKNYKPKEGNLKNVVLINNDDDQLVMKRNILSSIAGSRLGLDEMPSVSTANMEHLLVQGQTQQSDLKAVKLQPSDKDDKPSADVEQRTYTADGKSTVVIDLWKAKHCVAGDGAGGSAIFGKKYNDHDYTQNLIISQWLGKLGTPERTLGS